jgi:hypothetical protein
MARSEGPNGVDQTLLERRSKCPILLVIQAQPNVSSSDHQTEFESLAIPIVCQAIAAPSQFPKCLLILEGELYWEFFRLRGPEAAVPPVTTIEVHEDELLVCAKVALLSA